MKDEDISELENEINNSKIEKKLTTTKNNNGIYFLKILILDIKNREIIKTEKKERGNIIQLSKKDEKEIEKNEEFKIDVRDKNETNQVSEAVRLKTILDKISKGILKNSYSQAIEKVNIVTQTTQM